MDSKSTIPNFKYIIPPNISKIASAIEIEDVKYKFLAVTDLFELFKTENK